MGNKVLGVKSATISMDTTLQTGISGYSISSAVAISQFGASLAANLHTDGPDIIVCIHFLCYC